MVQKLILPIVLIVMIACTENMTDYWPEHQLTQKQQEALVYSVIRYVAEPPPNISMQDKFDAKFDGYYNEKAKSYRLDLYHVLPKKNDTYLMLSRPAPSILDKRVATGINLRIEGDRIEFYNEVFRTWKMEEKELMKKGLLLFDNMVNGKDLSPYYPANSGKEEYIEFPDDNTFFDTISRAWVSKLEVPAILNLNKQKE
jgi:hypothetical protein